jgi:plastocyanin domain-containing protein
MNKIASIIITLGLVVAIGIMFVGGGKNSESVQNVEIRDGVQYITINAKGGYFPRESVARAGVPTKLIVETDGTYDCSASLVVRSAGFQKLLPQTGETEIDIGIPKAGVPLQGVCGMGMYSFNVDFQN